MKSALTPYFVNIRGNIIPGSHRLQKLLTKYLNFGILNFPCILVTGSNGKGTTCAYLEIILREHNIKTGLYTSPHLVNPNERIRINGIPVDESKLEENLAEILEQKNKHLPDASFFEITTAVAFLIFLKEKIDFLICEVGLGGHHDSTNALSPLLSVLTSVSLEHTQFLGDTLKKIAADKSHISRRNRPFIVAPLCEEALLGVNETVNKIGSYVVPAENFSQEYPSRNAINLNTALTAIKYLPTVYGITFEKEKIRSAVQNMFWPGRFDIRTISNRTVIFDAAHNPEGFEFFLNQYFKSSFANTKCVLLFASLNDKDWKTVLKKFPLVAEHVIFTQIDSSRSVMVEEFLNESKNYLQMPTFEIIADMSQAVARSMTISPHLPLLITGSIAFIGNVMEHLNIEVFIN